MNTNKIVPSDYHVSSSYGAKVNGYNRGFKYFIEFNLNDGPTFVSFILFHKEQLSIGTQEATDIATKSSKENDGKLVFKYQYMGEWIRALESFSSKFKEVVKFKAYCEDEFMGSKDLITTGS